MTPKTLDKYIAALKKKAAASGMTQAEYESELSKMMDEMAQQYLDNKITSDEYSKVSVQIDNAKKSMALQGKTAAAPVSSGGMTYEEYIGLWKDLKAKNKAGLITKDEYYALGAKLDQAYKDKKTAADTAKEIGCDPGTKATDDAIVKLGKKFRKIYGEAEKDMQTKLSDFLKKFQPQIDDLNGKLADGSITPEEMKKLEMKLLQQKILGQKIDQLTGIMTNANKKAMAEINGDMLGVFADNAAYQSYQLTKDANMDLMFSIYDEHTVKHLIDENPELIPRKEVNGKKDAAWNKKQIAGAVTQGIIQGDSIPSLARRIAMQTGESNSKAMMRYARTAMTAAQNSGRIEMLHRAHGMGIQCKKRWLATLDSRTRDSHQKLDGVAVGVDDKFPNGLQYPGDPNGDGAEVWNCRCTLVYDYEGFPNDAEFDVRRDNESSEEIANMPYDEWKAAKKSSILNSLSMAKVDLAAAQKEVIGKKINESKVYEGIWKDPVTLADYPDKAGSIQAKRDYYTAEIQKYKDAHAIGAGWATDEKIKELQKKLKQLNEFEKYGQLIQKRNKALKKVQDLYAQAGIGKTAAAPAVAQKAKKAAKKTAKAAGGTSAGTGSAAANTASLATAGAKKTQFEPDAWDAATKRAAQFYDDRYDADKKLRPLLDADWDKLTDEQKYAVWEYTHNSHPMNRPLTGYNDTWEDSGWAGGPDRTEWGHEDNYGNRNLKHSGEMDRFGDSRGQPSFKKAITELTKAIETVEPTKEGMWLVRGSNENAFAGWFRSAGMDYDTILKLFDGRHTEKQMQDALVGRQALNHAFTSTGIAKDAGFDGNVKYKIYAPKGTKGIYAEPQSHYGRSMGRQDRIYKKGSRYSDVGGEAEVILQRGTMYVCTGLRITGYDYRGKPEIEVTFEIQEQPDYFVYGDEDTYNQGKTRHKR